jgi:hypothetical protein
MRVAPLLTCIFMLLTGAVQADPYPVDGTWTYKDPDGKGAASSCPESTRMTFLGERRLDTGTGVPDYRNKSVDNAGNGNYRVTDNVFNGLLRGTTSYDLTLLDPDHIQLRYENGKIFKLRRCAS